MPNNLYLSPHFLIADEINLTWKIYLTFTKKQFWQRYLN